MNIWGKKTNAIIALQYFSVKLYICITIAYLVDIIDEGLYEVIPLAMWKFGTADGRDYVWDRTWTSKSKN